MTVIRPLQSRLIKRSVVSIRTESCCHSNLYRHLSVTISTTKVRPDGYPIRLAQVGGLVFTCLGRGGTLLCGKAEPKPERGAVSRTKLAEILGWLKVCDENFNDFNVLRGAVRENRRDASGRRSLPEGLGRSRRRAQRSSGAFGAVRQQFSHTAIPDQPCVEKQAEYPS